MAAVVAANAALASFIDQDRGGLTAAVTGPRLRPASVNRLIEDIFMPRANHVPQHITISLTPLF